MSSTRYNELMSKYHVGLRYELLSSLNIKHDELADVILLRVTSEHVRCKLLDLGIKLNHACGFHVTVDGIRSRVNECRASFIDNLVRNAIRQGQDMAVGSTFLEFSKL